MKPDRDSSFDLLVLARRGSLSEADERKLRDVVASSAESKALFDAGMAFDHEAPVLPGDEERIAKIALQVERRLYAPKSSRRFLLRACVAAALVAATAIGASMLRKEAPATPAPIPSALPPVAPVVVVVPSIASDEPAPIEPPKVAPTPVRPKSIASAEVVAPASAAELFAAASRARVAGDRAESIRVSRELITRYPSSDEARSTHLSLGMLYLHEGQAAPALDEFRNARKVGAAATTAEAMWGESQALRQLGRAAEERAVLEELLRAYPSSAYAGAARKRLADLP